MTFHYTSDVYVNEFRIAAHVLLKALMAKGYHTISLDHLYDTLGAEDRAQKTSIRWAVQDLKDQGFLGNTKTKKVYEVLV